MFIISTRREKNRFKASGNRVTINNINQLKRSSLSLVLRFLPSLHFLLSFTVATVDRVPTTIQPTERASDHIIIKRVFLRFWIQNTEYRYGCGYRIQMSLVVVLCRFLVSCSGV